MSASKSNHYLDLAKKRLQESLLEKTEYTATVCNKEFIVLPGVFSPKYFIDTEFFAENIKFIPGEQFLEIGSGTGVISVFAALKGSDVVATDISHQAVLNTTKNAELHQVSDKIDVLGGSLFESVRNMKFNTIFWNIPFNNIDIAEPITTELLSIADPGDFFKIRFIQESVNFLKPNGKILIGTSSNYGDFETLTETLEETGYEWKIAAQKVFSFNGDSMNLELIEARKR